MNSDFPKHLSDEELMDAYYGEAVHAAVHLSACSECRERAGKLREMLDSFRQIVVPARDEEYGSRVWDRMRAQLPAETSPARRLRWLWLMPAFAALLAIAFVTGRLMDRASAPAGISEKARERVMLMSLSDHLEQSQIVLANVANGEPVASGMENERDRARELLGANRLLRQTAVRLGDLKDAALLEELERVLLDVANGPDRPLPSEMKRTRYQIDQQGLLFRVRVTSVACFERGKKL